MAKSAPSSPHYTGFFRNTVNGRLAVYYDGTLAGYFTASGYVGALGALTTIDTTTTITAGSTLTATTTIAAGTTITAGTGLTVTTGNDTVSTGDLRVTAGNERLGVVSAFGTTEPTSAVVMKQGTAAVGAIATSGALFASATVLRKIIADGTASNVET